MKLPSFTFSAFLFCFQVVLVILYAVIVDYEAYDPTSQVISGYYPVFQDVHIMLFVGFAFLMAFLKKHGYSSSGFTLIIGATIIQWGMLVSGLVSNAATGTKPVGKVKIGIPSMLTAEFNTCAILITFATILGKANRVQYLVIAIIEVIIFNINEMVCVHHLKIADAGGSIVIHMFGCYFGLAVAFALRRDETTKEENPKESTTYTSDLFAMLGTCILWALWPSFNGALLGPGAQQSRVIINTYLSLAASCVITYIVSPLLNKDGKLNMVHIQNATLAGGVAVGTASNLLIGPWAAMTIGFIGGFFCMIAFHYLHPFLRKSLSVHDSCGVHNLHGIPGIISGIATAVAAVFAHIEEYGNDLYSIWPARAPAVGTAEFVRLSANYTVPIGGVGRTPGVQAGMQAAAIPLTMIMAIIGGLITGFLARFLDLPDGDDLFDDKAAWELPDGEADFKQIHHAVRGSIELGSTELPQKDNEFELKQTKKDIESTNL